MSDEIDYTLPQGGLVLLIGPSGAGKTTYVNSRFPRDWVLSSDHYREVVSGKSDLFEATDDAFDVMAQIARARLRRGLMTIIDATNLRSENRRKWVQLAHESYASISAILFDVDADTCERNNNARPNPRSARALKEQMRLLEKSKGAGRTEKFYRYYQVTPNELKTIQWKYPTSPTDRRNMAGPFDIIGDVHGCIDELLELVAKLGYEIGNLDTDEGDIFVVTHPEGRRLIGLGDYCDRGPDPVGCLRFWMDAVASGVALAIKGNHDFKLFQHLKGHRRSDNNGFGETKRAIADTPESFRIEVTAFIHRAQSHLWLDDGNLVVAHAGIKAEMIGRTGPLVTQFTLYGDTNGETDAFNRPIRLDWAQHYRGKPAVVYGHVTHREAVWVNNTICIDTACYTGNKLTALRWPERELVSVPARAAYADPERVLVTHKPPVEIDQPAVGRITSRFAITTRFAPKAITISKDRAQAGFETLVRHAADPRWLIFVPPTTATVNSSKQVEYLERPEEAFEHYRAAGITDLVVQEKHMGSRAVVTVCRHDGSRFNDPDRRGIVLSKSGRTFFDDPADEAQIIDTLRAEIEAEGLWDEYGTDWFTFDGEMLPWNAKAGGLIRETFAAAGSAAFASRAAVVDAFAQAAGRGVAGALEVADRALDLMLQTALYQNAYRPFLPPYNGREDLRFAPFLVLATEGLVRAEETHLWHMAFAQRLARKSKIIVPTRFLTVDLNDEADCRRAIDWWEELTGLGQEGFMVKPPYWLANPRVAPAIKVRGRNYLRIIYGINYTDEAILKDLKVRNTAHKRAMAFSGMALGLESLQRFVDRKPQREIVEVVAASVALASEPLDVRL